MAQRWKRTQFCAWPVILMATLGIGGCLRPMIAGAAVGGTSDGQRSATHEVWSYSQFLQAVQSEKVDRVQISADRSRALATTQEGSTVLVCLPSDPQMVKILTDHNVDIFMQPLGANPESDLASISCASPKPDRPQTWRYSEFVQAVQSKKVARVRISADRSRAWVITRDGQTVRVDLPNNDPDLINLLTTHGVEISVYYSPAGESF